MKTKYALFLIVVGPAIPLFCLPYTGYAQIKSPVKWSYAIKKITGNDYSLIVRANLQSGWHVYSSEQPREAISTPTKISIDDPQVLKIGPVRELGDKEEQSLPGEHAKQYYFAGKVDFVQLIRLKNNQKELSGSVTYMICTDQECLPEKSIPFRIKIEELK